MTPLGSARVGALRWILCRYWLMTFEQPVPPAASINVAPPPGVVIRRATTDDAAAVAPLLSGLKLEPRLARGDIGLVSEVDGQVVGCTWLTSAPLHIAAYQMRVTPRRHELYGYGLYVVPEARGRGVGMALRREVIREAQRLGARACVYHVEARDPAIIAWHQAAGAILREWSFDIILLDRFRIPVSRRPGAATGRHGA